MLFEYKPSDFVKEWKERYNNKWATDFHIQNLLKLKMISKKDFEYITTNKQ